MKDEDALNSLANLFPAADRNFLEDVFVSSSKDYDKTVDQLLSMGMELSMGNKDQKPTPTPLKPTPAPINTAPVSRLSPPPTHIPSHAPSHHAPSHHAPAYVPEPPLIPTPAHITPVQSVNISQPAPITSPPLTSSITYPSVPTVPNMFNVPATPPPINTNNISKAPVASAPPSAPPSKPADGSVEQKRLETLKQELALEYQRINDTHKYNLEVQQKLEQLREYTTAEQRKLDEQRALLQDDKRKFTEELTARFKSMQEEHTKLKEQLERREQERIAAMEAEAEAMRQAKEIRKREKAIKREEEAAARELEERRKQELAEQEKREYMQRIEEEKDAIKQHYEDVIMGRDVEIRTLHEQIESLHAQLDKAASADRASLLDFLSTLSTSIAESAHNGAATPVVGDTQEEKNQDFRRNIYRSIATSFTKRANDVQSEN